MVTVRHNETVPDEVVAAQASPRVPNFDPTLGIAGLPPDAEGRPDEEPAHRLVAVGDSLTHGFQSGAIHNTRLSYPALIARELGIYDRFQHPSYDRFGGLPMNLEYFLRELESRFGERFRTATLPLILFKLQDLMDETEVFWEADAQEAQRFATRNHNLGIYGWDLYDANMRTAADCRADIESPTDARLKQLVQNANERAALRVLAPGPVGQELLSPLATAVALGNDGTLQTPGAGDGIETLIVMLGANNALGTITKLRVRWSIRNAYEDPVAKQHYTVWDPEHFRQELARVVERVRTCRARHVIWATVPHVTIAPMARGIGETKVAVGSRYFEYYTRPWVTDDQFDPDRDEDYLTSADARAIDSAIDLYNAAIEDAIRVAREEGKNWLLLDICGLLDRIAARRYILDEKAQPAWWTRYELPQPLLDLPTPPDSRFLRADTSGQRKEGGLFSLDGIHPTTVMYGLMAEEYIGVMKGAGVEFRPSATANGTQIDFKELIRRDSLLEDPPQTLTGNLELMGRVDDKWGFAVRMLTRGR